MKKIVLFLFPLLLLSCNNTKEDEPNNPKNDNTENTDLGYFNLIIANTSYLDDLYFSIEDLLYSNTLSPKSRVQIKYKILKDNQYSVTYKDIENNTRFFSIKNTVANKTYILSFNTSRNPEMVEYTGTYTLKVTNETVYSYKCVDLYNNSTYVINPSKSVDIKNLPCNLTNSIGFYTNYSSDNVKYTQYFMTFKKTIPDYVYTYEITKVPLCDDHNLCYLYLINKGTGNFRLLDRNKKELLSVAPGKTGVVAVPAGSNKIIIQQKDGYILYPDEYTFDGLIPKCGSVEFTVTDDECTWKAYN